MAYFKLVFYHLGSGFDPVFEIWDGHATSKHAGVVVVIRLGGELIHPKVQTSVISEDSGCLGRARKGP